MLQIFNFSKSKTKKYTIKKFTDKIGLLYFGSVNQNTDEHNVIRGFTLSPTHHDSHFSVGSSDGYDIYLVDRKDAIYNLDGTTSVQNWLIMTFKLKTKQDLPHFLIKAIEHDDKPYIQFFETFPTISEINLGTFEDYSESFLHKYAVYTRQSLAIQIQKLIPANTAEIFGDHAWPLTVEQNEHILYVYSTSMNVTENLLDVMYENGLWLAGQIDYQAELV